jgi:bis(5'-nucleosyl)-tetraphosphatase (symmetrical)
MSNYAIGDVQGCFAALQALLTHIQFNADQDTLWFVGDLVNRGPQSLATLRFIKALGDKHHIVLGNHDLHLLARAHHAHPGWKEDTLAEILTAPDKDELFFWLARQPLFYYDEKLNYCMAHAGLAPVWDLTQAQALAQEVSDVLQSGAAGEFFHHMYGNTPCAWRDDLQGWDRLRCITNYFTRVRFCFADGSQDLEQKGNINSQAKTLMPWYEVPDRKNADLNILFGHWAALAGVTNTPHTYALDTGCVWGFSLTAMRLEDQRRFQVSCAI